MKVRNLFLLLAGIAVGVLLGLGILRFFASTGGKQSSPSQVRVGDGAPDFALPGLDGKTVRLSQYRGKAVLVNFWATWCKPCKNEMPLLQRYYHQFAPDLVVLGINSGETQQMAADFAQANKIDFPILLGLGANVEASYTVVGFPTSFFIDREGILRAVHIGELSEEQIDEYFQTIGLVK